MLPTVPTTLVILCLLQLTPFKVWGTVAVLAAHTMWRLPSFTSPPSTSSTHCVLQNAGIACGPYSLTLSDGQQLTVDLAFACLGSIPQCPTGLPVSSHGVLVLPTLQVCPDCLMLACNILLASAKLPAADRVPCILSEGHRPACMAVSNKGRDGEMNQS